MKHLFIINSNAAQIRGRIPEVVQEIKAFFANYPQFEYDIHVTRWKRDATGYSRRYVTGAREIVRVYAVGGTSTLFEVVNGVIGVPNVQVGVYPFGKDNAFLQYFGKGKLHLFQSLRNLVFSGVTSMDAMLCGNNYGMSSCYIGVDAMAAQTSETFVEQAGAFFKREPILSLIYVFAGFMCAMKKDNTQYYRVSIDGATLDGEYLTILTANQPYYGPTLYPAIDARPNDGMLDIYLLKPVSKMPMLKMGMDYVHGRYHKWPRLISHYRGKSVSISSDQFMSICLDGEMFFNTSIDHTVIPHAIDFVCPGGVDPLHPEAAWRGAS
ncbi:MAG: hypothetical protein LBT68_01515 [Spirochaetales bacterium]|jgi:diacylglycerol kinase family enzyme|nr:hypothetical protein [Spirochaetales bacterium]